MNRQAAFKIFVGTNGTGKTTTMKHYLGLNERNLIVPSNRADTAWQGINPLEVYGEWVDDDLRPGKKKAVVRIKELNTFTGTRILHVDGDSRIMEALGDQKTGYRDGGLFLDDFRQYMQSKGSQAAPINALFIGRRHKMVDLFLACHSPQDISADLIRFNPQIVVHYTTSPPNDNTLSKLPDGQAFIETVNRVNAENMKQPEGRRFYCEEVPRV